MVTPDVRRRSIRNCLLLGVATLIVLVGGVFIALRILLPPERIGRMVHDEVSRIAGREVSLGSARLRVIPRIGVQLEGLAIAAPADTAFSRTPLLVVERIDVSISPWSLLLLKPTFHEVRIVRPQVFVEVLADGRTSLEGLGDAGAAAAEPVAAGNTLQLPFEGVLADGRTSLDGLGNPGATSAEPVAAGSPLQLPFPLSIRAFVLEQARAVLLDRESRQDLVFDGIDQTLNLEADRALERVTAALELQVRRIKVSGPGLPVRQDSIPLALTLKSVLDLPGARIDINHMQVGLDSSLAVVVSGSVDQLTSPLPRPTLEIRSTSIDLGRLLALTPRDISPWLGKLSLGGNLQLDAKVSPGPDSSRPILVEGSVSVSNLSAAVEGVPERVERLDLLAFFTDTSVRVDSMQMTTREGSVRAALAIEDLKRVPVVRHLNASGDLELGALRALSPGLNSMALGGTVGFSVNGAGSLSPTRSRDITLQARAELKGVGVSLPELPHRVLVSGTAQASSGAANADLKVNTGPSDLAVTARFTDWLALVFPKHAGTTRMRVDVGLRSTLLDLDPLLPPPDTLEPEPPASTLPPLPPVDGEIRVQVATLRAKGLALTPFRTTLVLSNGRVIATGGGGIFGGTVEHRLDLDLSDPALPGADLGARLREVHAGEAFSALATRVPPRNALTRLLPELAGRIEGRTAIDLAARGRAPLPRLLEVLTADLRANFRDGSFHGFAPATALFQSISEAMPGLSVENRISFGSMEANARLQEGAVLFDALEIEAGRIGDIRGAGRVGLDQKLALSIDVHLPPETSQRAQGGAQALMGRFDLRAGNLLPTDDRGRVLLPFLIEGTITSPRVRPDHNRMTALVRGAAATMLEQEKRAIEDAARDRARQAADTVRRQVETELRERTAPIRDRAREELQRRLPGLGR